MIKNVAETLLLDLGVSSIDEIDLMAIAFELGVVVKYGNLKDCDARIVGLNDKAVITLKNGISEKRTRFSLAHEIGHWYLHKGKRLDCQGIGHIENKKGPYSFEKEADKFASNLLMPDFLLLPFLQDALRVDLQLIRKISEIFNVSVVAAAIRVCESAKVPMILAYKGIRRNYWYKKSSVIPHSLRPKFSASSTSSSFIVVNTDLEMTSYARKVSASNWFGGSHSLGFCVGEQSIKCAFRDALTLITFPDPKFLTYYN